MFVKKSYDEDKNTEKSKHDIDYEDDEEEDTLSFYEFSVNSDADAWRDSSRESNNSSFKSYEQEEDDYFEFFSEELKMNTTTTPENIIFCGKIIPYKQPISEIKTKDVVKETKHRRRGFFRWRWSFTSSKHPCTTSNIAKKELPKQKCSTRKRSKLHGFSVQKLSIFTSPVKSRWHSYLFGISRFRSEMELRDIKNRQSRRSPSFSLFRLESREDKIRECKGAWGVLRALSCGDGHHQANAVVPAAIVGRFPRV